MIQRQPIGDAAAAIMAGNGKARKAQLLHHGHHVRAMRPLGIGRMVRGGGRAAAAPVAAQIGAHHRELAAQAAAPRRATSDASRESHAAEAAAARSPMERTKMLLLPVSISLLLVKPSNMHDNGTTMSAVARLSHGSAPRSPRGHGSDRNRVDRKPPDPAGTPDIGFPVVG